MPTWADLRLRVQREMNMEDSDFVTSAEMLSYANRAINKAESIILNLNADYFLAEPVTLSLVSGQQTYSLPADIYGQKIKMLQYYNGSQDYQIKKITDFSTIPRIQASDQYKYILTSHYTNGHKIRLYPTPAESGDYVTVWYLRNAEELVDDADNIDLPEAYDYITQYIKDMCINKERNTPDAPPSANLMKEEELLVASLHQRTVDEQLVSPMEIQEYMNEVS